MKTNGSSRVVVGGASAPLAPEAAGGKAANLDRLLRLGVPVPPWFCITAAVLDGVWARVRPRFAAQLAGLSPDRSAEAVRLGEAVRRALLELPLEAADEELILEKFDALFGPDGFVAVRSSAIGEDSARSSFAGQMATYLWVPREHLIARVKDCLASAFSDRALLYRCLRQVDNLDVRAAVVVQQMVNSRVSGILFTVNPATCDAGEMMVTAGYGLGEGVVADQVETDTFVIDRRAGGLRSSDVRDKSARVVFDAAARSGTRLAGVPPDLACAPALSRAQLDELLRTASAIETHFGCPQDIEWAIDEEARLWMTQARPITTLQRGAERIFDNSNIIEGYPGVTTPLTFSFARMAYEAVFRRLALAFGVPEKLLDREAHVLQNMVGLIDGRMYYNLLSFYRFYSIVPGFEKNLEAWKKAVGLDRKDPTEAVALSWRERFAWLPAQLGVYGRIVRNFATLPRAVRAFEAYFERSRAAFQRTPCEEQSADELLERYERLYRDMVGHWDCTVVNDLYTVNFFELLRKLTVRWGLDESGSLRNDLLCGEKGMESVAPVRSLLDLTQRIRDSAELLALLEETPDDRDAWRAVSADPRCSAFHAAALAHIQRFGDRTVQELKLETPGLDRTPHQVITLCRSYLRADRRTEELDRREAEVRGRAEQLVAQRLRGHPIRRALYRLVLKQTRAMVRNRENTRFARTRGFGMIKRLFRAIGRRFTEQRVLDDPEDIFYLTVEEIAGYVRGASVTRSLKALVALRREELAGFQRSRPPSRVTTRGIACAGASSWTSTAPAEDVASGQRELRGQGCSPGRRRALARVVLDPARADALHGRILVAPMTDPGWVFLMVAAQGLVAERGSPLSHTAIIGRELGIPTVVGVPGATRLIQDGQLIEIDGAAGVVHIHDVEEGTSTTQSVEPSPSNPFLDVAAPP